MVDYTTKLPLYEQVKNYIAEGIRNEKWKPGDLLPPEPELQRLLRVSRVTVRRGIEELEHEGLVIKKQGKGTFVAATKLSYPLPKLTSFSEDIRQKGHNPGSKTITVAVCRNEQAANAMGLSDKLLFLYLRRLRTMDGITIGVQDSYINLELLPLSVSADAAAELLANKLEAEDSSLFEIFEGDYGVTIGYADEVLEAISCSKEFSPLLEIKTGAPLLLLTRLNYTADGRPLEYVRMYNRADIYKYSIQLYR